MYDDIIVTIGNEATQLRFACPNIGSSKHRHYLRWLRTSDHVLYCEDCLQSWQLTLGTNDGEGVVTFIRFPDVEKLAMPRVMRRAETTKTLRNALGAAATSTAEGRIREHTAGSGRGTWKEAQGKGSTAR